LSVELLELAAQRLEPLLDEVVFLGGATLTLWITDPGAPSPRPTKDVDVVVEVTTRSGFHVFEVRGREELVAEVRDANNELRTYLAGELGRLAAHPRFREGVAGALQADFASQARADTIVLPRLDRIGSNRADG
jgi:D-ribose pyranose/furanose isomerase RbsD